MIARGPCEVWFYHLERTGLDQALPELLEKTLQRGWKAIVHSASDDRLEHLDGWLWSYRDESFLPHGLASEPNAERQPVLLTTGPGNPNGASIRFLAEGAPLPDDAASYERIAFMFDGNDEDAVARARDAWREVRQRGLAATYWRQNQQGRWEKQG